MPTEELLSRFSRSRSGVLGTVAGDGQPHLVPCCFVLIDHSDGQTAYTAVDGKPKSTMALKRLDNIRAHPRATLLVDHFDEDWAALWWIRADGVARVVEDGSERVQAIDRLVEKYSQYQAMRPGGAVIAIDVTGWRSWSASG